jgi:hypothetical protein
MARDQRHPQPAPAVQKKKPRRKKPLRDTTVAQDSSPEIQPDPDYHANQEPVVRLLRRFHTYKPGATFYLKQIPKRDFKNPHDEELYKISKKLQDRYSGPHTVISQVNPVIYNCLVNNKAKKIHLNKMKRDTAHDHRDIDFSDAIGLQFQDDSPEEANQDEILGSSSSPQQDILANAPSSPDQAPSPDQQIEQNCSTATVCQHSQYFQSNQQSNSTTEQNRAPSRSLPRGGPSKTKLTHISPRRSPRLVYKPQANKNNFRNHGRSPIRQINAHTAQLHEDSHPTSSAEPGCSPVIPTTLSFGI